MANGTNSRGLVWMRMTQQSEAHAFITRADGTPTQSVCSMVNSPVEWVETSRRSGRICHRCKGSYNRLPKIVGQTCETPQPDGKGRACRNCGFAIHPLYPGWKHAVRGAA